MTEKKKPHLIIIDDTNTTPIDKTVLQKYINSSFPEPQIISTARHNDNPPWWKTIGVRNV